MGCIKILQPLLFIFNLLFWLGGVVCFALGIYLLFISDSSSYFSVHSTHPGSWRVVGWLLVGAGLPVALLGCCGCFGAYRLNQPALVTFVIFLIIIFCLELAAAYIAFNKQAQAQRFIEASMYDTVRNRYGNNNNYKEAFDEIQTSFECCGVKSYFDWLGSSWDNAVAKTESEEDDEKPEHGIGAQGGRGDLYGRVPESCCNELGLSQHQGNCGVSFSNAPLTDFANKIHDKGCSKAVYDWAYAYLDIVIGVCVIVGAVQLLGIVLAMCLCCCVNAENKKEYDY